MNELKHNLGNIFNAQLNNRVSLAKTGYRERKRKLKLLLATFLEMEGEAEAALYADMKKSATEAGITEIMGIKTEASFAIKNLRKWMKTRRVGAPLMVSFTRGWVRPEPKGTVLIISPWNYPILLVLNPLIAAVAAGNTAIIKPSEFTPASAAFVKKLIEKVFPENEVAVVLGDHEPAIELLKKPFNHIVFTGSPSVGKIVMEAASKHLAGVTLELGGKSPVVVDETANVSDAAWKLAFYKFTNAGQTCTAPDYVLCHKSKQEDLIAGLAANFKRFFKKNGKHTTEDYCQIINQKHFDRVSGYIDSAVSRGASVVFGGRTDKESRFIEPTVLSNVSLESEVMTEEIFGPILPILPYENLDDVVSFINKRHRPLALYVFSSNKKNQDKLMSETCSGSFLINDCVINHANPHLPFGGINNSGIGSYHGKFGFDELSHHKAILKSTSLSPFKLMLPPYTPLVKKLVKMTKKLA
jgi:aldehyde dehydrogenase (NAD+)